MVSLIYDYIDLRDPIDFTLGALLRTRGSEVLRVCLDEVVLEISARPSNRHVPDMPVLALMHLAALMLKCRERGSALGSPPGGSVT